MVGRQELPFYLHHMENGITVIDCGDLYKLLDAVHERPLMFIGSRSLTVLHSYINGYNSACSFKGIKEELKPAFEDFDFFVTDYYMQAPSTAGWKNILLAAHYGNEENAFNDFFVLFDQFRSGSPNINSRRVVLELLERMLHDPACLNGINDDAVIALLKSIPARLGELFSISEFYFILLDIRQAALSNVTLAALLTEVAGTDAWKDDLV